MARDCIQPPTSREILGSHLTSKTTSVTIRAPSTLMARCTPVTGPLISVVTPFYNTKPYLAQCIQSVLAQTYPHFEYILMDNCSTDGSAEIAEDYACRDRRIRLIRCSEFLPQLPNYNRALRQISDGSKYCKLVQADDWIFPECLELMVQAFEQSESIGLVSSYWLEGSNLGGAGLPWEVRMLQGTECARLFLRTGIYVFGSPTQQMYRSSCVRQHEAFYDISLPFGADVQKAVELLKDWDCGFVHQVLSFTRRGNDGSIYQSQLPFSPDDLLWYIIARRHAPLFLGHDEAALIIRKKRREYYRALARAVLRLEGPAFWQYHKVGLKALSKCETHDWLYLTVRIAAEFLWLASNPGTTGVKAFRLWKRKGSQESHEPGINRGWLASGERNF